MRGLSILFPFSVKCIVHLLLMRLSLEAPSIDAATTGSGNETDHLALLEFKAKIVHDPQNVMSSWNDSAYFCNWQSVTCGRRHKRVTILDLQSKGLVGFLSPYIGNLSFLREIRLGNNSLQGKIPAEVGRLFRLQAFELFTNQIEGKIPSNLSLCSNLIVLILEDNKLEGNIPTELANLSKLRQLSLAKNYLTGALPPSIREPEFVGGIPDALGKLNHLSIIGLGVNKFLGIIPPVIYNISSINIFSMAVNMLHGSLPSDMGILLPHLRRLQLQDNYLSNLFNLNEFYISYNNLSGNIPGNLGQCSSLEFLFMRSNNIQGAMPMSLISLKGLRQFDLSQNNKSGQIPTYLGKFALEYSNLSFNNFEGEVPTEGVFANVSSISLEGNKRLCGGIPELRLPRCIIDESKKRKLRLQSPGSLEMKSFRKLSYQRILKATEGFSTANFLGAGRFRSVYKGTLEEDGAIVAVKVLNLQQRGAEKSLMAECKVLQNIRHRNLVRIMTSCSTIDFQGNDFKALVYEYMPNGNLDKCLSLLQGMNIAIDVGSALDYLHHGCQKPIIHCDLKPGNDLLDNDMVAHIGDFGLAKLLSQLTNPIQSSSVGVRGTVGYAAPGNLTLLFDTWFLYILYLLSKFISQFFFPNFFQF
ncbi:hypothetical protein P3X46_013266 [Hevea brasiliensis]|uniref:Protein kinase domain-containing protein n=1 Tax=Hevea brasiliensis TaxID=3981 RepID=A0ABQ9M4T1_HEVBR|nr:hypothetical protein P3X46_013266 [Hevea brasiliensis]